MSKDLSKDNLVEFDSVPLKSNECLLIDIPETSNAPELIKAVNREPEPVLQVHTSATENEDPSDKLSIPKLREIIDVEPLQKKIKFHTNSLDYFIKQC